MKRKFTRVAAVLCGMSLLLTGCRIGNKNIVVSNILNDRQVFKIEGTVCSLKEARVYLTNYQNIYGTAYGVDLWKHDFGDDSLVKYIKAVTMEELTRWSAWICLHSQGKLHFQRMSFCNIRGGGRVLCITFKRRKYLS